MSRVTPQGISEVGADVGRKLDWSIWDGDKHHEGPTAEMALEALKMELEKANPSAVSSESVDAEKLETTKES